jgi:hypothetical protein
VVDKAEPQRQPHTQASRGKRVVKMCAAAAASRRSGCEDGSDDRHAESEDRGQLSLCC